jgi:hypothetical protein
MRAASFLRLDAGSNNTVRIAMMAITTSSSISVNPLRLLALVRSEAGPVRIGVGWPKHRIPKFRIVVFILPFLSHGERRR